MHDVPMTLEREIAISVASGWTGIRINTDEPDDTMRAISAACRKRGWALHVWDRERGVIGDAKTTQPGTPAGIAAMQKDAGPAKTAVAAVRAAADAGVGGGDQAHSILVMKNFSRCFGKDPETAEALVSATQRLLSVGKHQYKCLVGLMPAEAKLPPEIHPLFKVIDHKLPDLEELAGIAEGIEVDGGEGAWDARMAATAALGLTRIQAEGVFGESVQLHKTLDRAFIWREKAKALNEGGILELYEGNLTYAGIGGLEGLKNFVRAILSHTDLEDEDPDARAKGVVAVGPPGVGKTLIAYATGGEVGLPAVLVNPGRLMDMYVGNTEKNTRRLFDVLERLAPCIAVIDEVGKLMSGGGSGDGRQTSKVDDRMLATFLTRMNDMTAPVFWFFTANDVETMHEAFLRAERVDAKFLVRLPGPAERATIWGIYLRKFFPEKIKGKDNPRRFRADADAILAEAEKAKRLDTTETGRALAAALMASPQAERNRVLKKVAAMPALAASVDVSMVADDRWTPAEIRSCCRLAFRLGLPLHQAALRVGHACMGAKGEELLSRLERWATNDGALDSETGELFRPDPEAADDESAGKVRRRVRRISDDA